MLKRFGIENGKQIATPMSTTCYLDKDEASQSVDITKYRGKIGSLLYLSVSRSDVMFTICILLDQVASE